MEQDERTGVTDEVARVKQTIEQVISDMKSVTITSNDQYSYLEAWLKRNKETQKMVDGLFEADRVRAKAEYDGILEDRNQMKKPLEMAERIARDKMTAYVTEREKVRREEMGRIEAERVREKEDARLSDAQTLSSMGRQDDADALLERKVSVSKSEVAAAVTTEKLGKTMEKWVVEVTDMQAFLRAQADALIPGCIEVKVSVLAASFKKAGVREYPGLKVDVQYVPVIS